MHRHPDTSTRRPDKTSRHPGTKVCASINTPPPTTLTPTPDPRHLFVLLLTEKVIFGLERPPTVDLTRRMLGEERRGREERSPEPEELSC